MKTKLNFLSLLAVFTVFFISCKGEKKNETDANAAEEVKETPVAAITYAADPASSTIEWVGKKPLGQHTGTIAISQGTLSVKGDAIESGTFMMDMNSITVTDLEGEEKAGLEGHLKGLAEGSEDHFFNVAKFPTASFAITGISEEEGKKYVKGNLTIKGISKNISFPVTTSTQGDEMTLSSETFTINRTQWNVNYGSKSIFSDLGDKFINDDIELKVTIKAKKA